MTEAIARTPLLRPILLATLICGTLDIALATGLTLARGKAVGDMLRFVASGPFPDAVHIGGAGSALGLAVHFALMAVMVAAFIIAAHDLPRMIDQPILWGALYGLATYVILDLVIVPLRFPAAWPPSALSIGTQLFAHVALVGIPTALIARNHLRARER